MKRRLLCIVLCIFMLSTLFPLGASAVDNGEPATKLTQTAANDDFSVTKSAVRNEDGTFNLTLSVTPLKESSVKPLELVILLDASGSMAWCTKDAHEHNDSCYNFWGKLTCKETHVHTGGLNPSCTLVGKKDASGNVIRSRMEIAVSAINSMVSQLQSKGGQFHPVGCKIRTQ